MYNVIHEFLDLQDNSYYYHVGDTYPRKGKKADLERTTELMGSGNKIGRPLIEYVADDPTPEEPVPAKPKKQQPKKKEK